MYLGEELSWDRRWRIIGSEDIMLLISCDVGVFVSLAVGETAVCMEDMVSLIFQCRV